MKTVLLFTMLAAPMFGQWGKTQWGMTAAEVAAVAPAKIEIAGYPFNVLYAYDKTGGLDKVTLKLATRNGQGALCADEVYPLLEDKYGKPVVERPTPRALIFRLREWLTPTMRVSISLEFCDIEYSKRSNTEGL